MKASKINFFFFLLWFFSILTFTSFKSSGSYEVEKRGNVNKLALIIAVGDYPTQGRWSKISSVNDIPLIKAALQKQGFPEENISVITDSEATKAGMVKALKTLEEKVQKDDIVVVHYSGHGQQIEDDNNDEIDGFDESVIPYDAQKYFKPGVYEGENHFRDEELGEYLADIRSKAGADGNMLVILDACHSGSGTRGNAKARGTQEAFVSPDFKPVNKEGEERGFTESNTRGAGSNQLAPMVLISGASQHELNFEYTDAEGNSYGSLSYAFSKSIGNADESYSYRTLFDKILIEMNRIAPNQSPQVEGQLDMGLFGGKVMEQIPYYLVDDFVDQATLKIKAGKLMGINKGTEIGLYDIGTTHPENSQPFATGKVIATTMVEAKIKLDEPVNESQAKNARIFITKANFGEMGTSISLKIQDKTLKNVIQAEMDKLPTVSLEINNPRLIAESKYVDGKHTLQLVTFDDMVLFSEPVTNSNANEIALRIGQEVKSYIRTELIKNLAMVDKDLDVSFEIIPVTVSYDDMGYPSVDKQLDANSKVKNGMFTFNPGDVFQIKITNNGRKDAYFQILDITPDNQVSILIPYEGATAEEFKIAPYSDPLIVPIPFAFSEPYGKEMFKLIATKEPVNLNGIVTTRGEGTRGDMSPLEMLVAQSYKQTRAGTLAVPPKSAHIHTMVFRIAEPE